MIFLSLTLSDSLCLCLSVCLCLSLSLSVCLSVCQSLSLSLSLICIDAFPPKTIGILPFLRPFASKFKKRRDNLSQRPNVSFSIYNALAEKFNDEYRCRNREQCQKQQSRFSLYSIKALQFFFFLFFFFLKYIIRTNKKLLS